MSKKVNSQLLYTILVVAFVVLSLVMNVTAVIAVPLIPNVGNLGVVRLDGSILQSIEITWALPLAAIMMVVADLLSELFTKKQTVLAIILGYAGGLFLSIWLLIGQSFLSDYASNNFNLVVDGQLVAHFLPWDALGQSWRFLLAGFIGYMGSNFVNTGIMWFMKARHGKNYIWHRMMISTFFGQIVDNFLFLTIAFMPLGLSVLEKSWGEIWLQVLVSVILEIIIEAVISPFTAKAALELDGRLE